MTKIKLTPPASGEKDSAAEPLVTTAIKEVEEWLNGKNIETTDNLKAGGIAEASLSTELQEKFTIRLGFVIKEEAASFNAVNEKSYILTKEGATATLPAPTANRIIAITCSSSINAIKVTASVGNIFSGLHQAGVATVEVTKSSTIVVEATGSNWIVISGEEKREQAWTKVSYTQAEIEAGLEVEPSATRPAQIILIAFPKASTQTLLNVAFPGLAGYEPQLTGSNAVQNSTIQVSFDCNPGQKWKAKAVAGTVASFVALTLLK